MSVRTPLSSGRKSLCVSVIVLSGMLIIVNLVIPILPVSGLTFILIALFIWFISLCVTFVGLHKLLQYNEPIPNTTINKYLQYVGLSSDTVCKPNTSPKMNAASIKRLSLDIDKYFISKWYCNISKDPDFVAESKASLEEVLTRLVDVAAQMNHACVLHELLNINLKHLKEFRRSLKRKEKYNVGIEELYRYSHICSTSTNKDTKDYFVHQLTTSLLQHFINSELWNSLPCHILVSILARKLICYLLKLLSNPEVLNYIILNSLVSNHVREKLKLDQYGRIAIIQFFDAVDVTQKEKTEESEKASEEKDETETKIVDELAEKAQELQQKVEEAAKQHKTLEAGKVVEEKAHKNTVIFRNRGRHTVVDGQNSILKSPKRTDMVKIYESKNTVRTWRDSRDLACVSLGQDPLDTLAGPPDSGGKAGSKQGFWETSAKSEDAKHELGVEVPSATHLFNEVIQMTSMEGLKTSIKPFSDATERTLHNIKDLQEATVHNALHKIGDFQDEAAGMVEGILDFGRAGFRKGLRLTGLQDNVENAKATLSNNNTAKTSVKSMREQVRKKVEELKKIDSESVAESADSVWINPLQADSPNGDGQVFLENSSNKPDTDTNKPPRIEDLPIPSISTEEASGTDSPDPEYEDTADLASSIAKLRSLLQQRSSESGLSTPALSPMPDEYMQRQIESGNASDAEVLEVDGVMPSFYKFCTKTASGVFSNTLNTIKTALPGNSTENVYTIELWKFIANQKESDTLIRMKKLLSERKEYCILDKEIDTAYDALDSMDVFQQSPVLISSMQFEDELDEFEGKIPVTKVLLDIVCELLADTTSPMVQEPMVKAVLLLLGPTIERKVTSLLDNAMEYLAENLIKIPETTNTNVLSMDIDDYIEGIESSSPDILRYFFGKENFRNALKLFISSLQKHKINEDVLLQGFELIAMKLIEESTQISPPASA